MAVSLANIISAAAFVVLTLICACWRMSTIIQQNTDAVMALTARIDRMDAGNAKEHNEMWDKIEHSEDAINVTYDAPQAMIVCQRMIDAAGGDGK